MDLKANEHEIYYDELINLISGNTDVASQYIIFSTGEDNFYALNVAKIEELIRNKDLEITSVSSVGNYIADGVTKIRDSIVVLVDFEKWIHNIKPKNKKPLIIICIYNNKKVGLLVDKVIGIQSVNMKNIYTSSSKDDKISHIIEIMISGHMKLCNIFDFDKLLFDIFDNIDEYKHDDIIEFDISNKTIYLAEDSKIVQNKLRSFLDTLDVKYEIFNNPVELLDKLIVLRKNNRLNEISLIITDIEMPVMDGISFAKELFTSEYFSKIPVIIHTNMANNAITKKAQDYQVKDIIKKFDFSKLRKSIYEYIK